MITSSSGIWAQIFSLQTLVAAIISALVSILGFYVKEQIDRRGSRRKYILDNGYVVHERLRDNLRAFLRENELFKYYTIPQRIPEALKQKVNSSFSAFKEDKANEWIEVTFYGSAYADFKRTLLEDIRKVAKLSMPSVQKLAERIDERYEETDSELDLIIEIFQEELNPEDALTPMGKSFLRSKTDAVKEMFWIEVTPLLRKLQKKVERVVKVQI